MVGFVMGFEGGSVSAVTNVFVKGDPEVGSSYKEGSVAAGPTGTAFFFALPVTDALSASSSRPHPLHCSPTSRNTETSSAGVKSELRHRAGGSATLRRGRELLVVCSDQVS